MFRIILALGVSLLAAAPAGAFDLSKVERKIVKEPIYKHKPKYALLVFGPEAKLRVWAVMDGPTLYLDRNGDGDLTATDEHFETEADCKNIELADPDGKTKYLITAVQSDYTVFTEVARKRRAAEGIPPQLTVNVDIKGPVGYRQYCDAQMRDDPRKSAIAHFHGPLTMGPVTIYWKLPPDLVLHTGAKPRDLSGYAGTMSAEHGCWVVVRSDVGGPLDLPKNVLSVVDVEFPAKQPGAPPIRKRFTLDHRC
jgi:hypothetical protein